MKLLILSDANSIHTKKWVTALSRQNQVLLFSLKSSNTDYYMNKSNIKVVDCNIKGTGFLSKLYYCSAIFRLKKVIDSFNPDILHAHYASSYGLLGAVSGYRPFVISVWGSDVYDFPKLSFFHKLILKFNLYRADVILSTSHIMALETQKYTSKEIKITPFGVDVDVFKRIDIERSEYDFIVGNVKALTPKYGIDILIKAFKQVVLNNPHLKMKLVIVGDGPNKMEYMQLVNKLQLDQLVEFKGRIPNEELTRIYNSFSVSVSVSNSESFGVVAVEAMACECPVITSDADGFTEVVEDGKTGIIVPKKDINATANAIQHLIDNPELCIAMGSNGRKRVLELYDWSKNVIAMEEIYNSVYYEHIIN